MTFKISDWLAVIAISISLFSVGWQLLDAIVGAETNLLSLKGRSVEIRCSVSSADSCWGSVDGSMAATGRLVVVLPVFLANTGALGENDVVSSVEIELQGVRKDSGVKLIANQFWNLVQGGGVNKNRPFVPFIVEGGGVNGGELRFAAFSENDFVVWDEVVTRIVSGEISKIKIIMQAYLVGAQKPVVRECSFVITERLSEIILKKKSKRYKRPRLTSTCK